MWAYAVLTSGGMPPQQLGTRTKSFAADGARLCRTLPKSDVGRVFSRQLFRAGTSVGANYRAVCRPRSDADFVAKLGTVIEECDDAAFWLELGIEIQLTSEARVADLLDEADQLIRIFVASRETVRRRLRKKKRK